MKFWKLILMMFLLGCISIIMIAFNPFSEENRNNRIEKKCFKKIESYSEAYDNYLLLKYDNEWNGIYSYVVNTDWIYVKKNRPDLYEEYIAPIKTEWDSIKQIPIEKTLLEGIPENVLKYKLKYKEIDKAKTRIKIKKSDGVDVANYQNTTIIRDTIN